MLPFLTTAPCGAVCHLADFDIKIFILLIVMFFRMFFTCALFQSIGELERFSAAAIKRPSLLLSLCQGDNLHCPLTQLPSLYFICKNKCTGGFVGFTHLTPAPLNQSFYIKPFYTNYSSGLLTCQRQIGI